MRLKVLLVCASVLVGAALFEIGVRVIGVDFNLSPSWRLHPVLGWSQVPGGSYDMAVEGRLVRVRFNSMGFRDVEHVRAKPPGVKRVVVIGDSFTEAVQVNLGETFHRRLEELLNQTGSTRWEVINLGVGDFGTAQEYIALMQYGLAFQPDVVVHQIFPANDICNNSLGLYGLCRSQNDRYRPYFVESGGELRQAYGQPIRTRLRDVLVSYKVIEYWVLKVLGNDPQNPDDPRRPAQLRKAGFKGLDPLYSTWVDAAEQPEAVVQGWRITERLIERIVQVTRDEGITYVGVVVPFEITLLPLWEKFVQLQSPARMNRTYPEQRLAAHFERLGVASVILMDEFQPYLSEVLPFIGGHFSVAGHRRAAEALCRRLLGSCITAGAAVKFRVPLPFHLDIGDSSAHRWMVTGWHPDETAGTQTLAWSDGPRSVLTVPLPAGGDIRMDLQALPFGFPGSPPQRVTVVLNGAVIGEVQLRPGLERYSVILPAKALRESPATLEFRYAYARKASDVLPASRDVRMLAVAWYAIDFALVNP